MGIRITWRTLWQSPRVTTVVVLTLGLGIGLLTTVFTFLNGYLWHALPYEAADRIGVIAAPGTGTYSPGGKLPREAYHTVREKAISFQDFAAYESSRLNVRVGDAVAAARVVHATASLVPLLRVRPFLGRWLEESDAVAGANTSVVLTYGLWRSRLEADPRAIGRTIYIGGNPATIIGVLPEDFTFERAEVFLPLRRETAVGDEFVTMLGRLRDGATFESAASELAVISSQLQSTRIIGRPVNLIPDMMMRRGIPGSLHWFFLIGTLFVLGIACANVVNVMFARGVTRQAERAVRATLGASSARLLRESLAESLIMTALATAIGLVLSIWTVRILLATIPNGMPGWIDFSVDWRVLAFTSAASLVTLMMIGVAPAREAARVDLVSVMKVGGVIGRRTVSTVRSSRRLIVLEIALAVALCLGTLLMVRSFQNVSRFDPGYDATRVLSVHLALDRPYDTPAREREFLDRFEQRLQGRPGIEGVSSEGYPQGFRNDPDTTWSPRHLLGLDGADPAYNRDYDFAVVEQTFPRVLGLAVVEGRFFDSRDAVGSEGVVVVSQSLARRLIPSGSILGHTLVFDSAGKHRSRVVGVLRDRYAIRGGLTMQGVPRQEVYFPAAQLFAFQSAVLLRSAEPERLRSIIEAELRAVDPNQAINWAETLADEIVGRNAVTARSFAALFGILGVSAFVLALIGMYGVISYNAEQRRAEIGLRMALGASTSQIARDVIGYGFKLAVVGVVIGIVLGFALARLVRILLFGVSTVDPLSCVIVAVSFTGVALLAAYGPARRALQVDPLTALRAQ